MAQVQYLKQPKHQQPKDHTVKFGDVIITISEDGNVTITGAKNISLQSEEFSVDSDRVKIHAKESFDMNVDGDIYLGSSTHLIMQAPRVDGNPDKGRKTGYKVSNFIKKLIRSKDDYYPSWRDMINGKED